MLHEKQPPQVAMQKQPPDPIAARDEQLRKPLKDWQAIVRSWGRTPVTMECKSMGWKAGSACGCCRRCAESPDRPPDGADIEEALAAARKHKPAKPKSAPRGSTYQKHAVALARQVKVVKAGKHMGPDAIDAGKLGKALSRAAEALNSSEPWRGWLDALVKEITLLGAGSEGALILAEQVLGAAGDTVEVDVGAPTSGAGEE